MYNRQRSRCLGRRGDATPVIVKLSTYSRLNSRHSKIIYICISMGSEVIIIEQEDECIRNFARHCHSFYLSSLSPASSSQSSLHQTHSSSSSLDEETTMTHNTSCNNFAQMTNNGKIVLEAFDRICAIVAVATYNNDTTVLDDGPLLNLQNEHDLCAKRNYELLKECGLLEIDNFFATLNAATLLIKYTEARDAMRRQTHNSAMIHRQDSFFELLSRAEQYCLTYPVETCTLPTTIASNHTTTTTVDGVKATVSTIEKFVAKYQPKIGSHSFLAGLDKFVNLQRNSDPSYVVQWSFRGSVLTEACLPAGADGDHLVYARDALKILFSFLILSKKDDIEGGTLEDGTEAAAEPMISFEIHKQVSNATLRRILNVLPNPKHLDARATGSLSVLTNSDNERAALRENVNGHLDEPWPLFQNNNFLVEFCTLL